MKNWVLHLVIFCSVLVFDPVEVFASAEHKDIERQLEALDKSLDQREVYLSSVKEKISQARLNLNKSKDLLSQYNALRNLYDLYRNYRIDSAFYIAEQRLDIAQQLGDQSKITSATLNLAEAYTMLGNPEVAIATIDTLEAAFMQDHHVKYRDNVYKKAYTMKKNHNSSNKERIAANVKLKAIIDEELKTKDKNSRGYLTLRAEQLRDAGLSNEAVGLIEEAKRKYDFSDNAAVLYTAGEIYLDAGRPEEAVDYLSRAALIDVEKGSKEYKALILLASALYQQGDIDRAFKYINIAFEDAIFSRANLRTEEIIEILPIINNTFYQKEKEIRNRTLVILVVAISFILFMLVFILSVVRAYKTKKRMVKTIEDINTQLSLQNRELIKSEELKLDVLSDFMVKFAHYLNQTKDYRKSMFRLLKSSQYEKALGMTLAQKDKAIDFNAFQEMFDVAFMSMFPDFIDKLNKFMITPVRQKDTIRLSPEIRMAALMRLGINSTDVIARMFNYSAQSVYNLRSTLRSMLNVSWEEFETQIRNI